MSPTRRTIALFSAGIPLALFAVAFEGAHGLWALPLLWLSILVIALGFDAARAQRSLDLLLEAEIPDRIYIGEAADIRLRLSLRRARAAPVVDALCDWSAILADAEVVHLRPTENSASEVRIPLRPLRRGTAHVERIWLRWCGPIRLVARQQTIALGKAIKIVPNIRALHSPSLEALLRGAFYGAKSQSFNDEGAEFEALREYTAGLDPRWIDWKASARHRHMFCREFRAERNHQIVLVFDTGRLMSESLDDIPQLDHAINAALITAYASLRSGDRVGVYAFDAQPHSFLEPLGGIRAMSRVQDSLAALEYHLEETNFTLGLSQLLTQLNRRSLVIVMSSFVDTVTAELMVTNLGRLAARHSVMFVTLSDRSVKERILGRPTRFDDVAGAVIANELGRDHDVVMSRLRRLGVSCLESDSRHLGPRLLNRYLALKRSTL